MRLVSARAWAQDIPLSRPYRISTGLHTHVFTVVVELRTADGRVGLGTAAPEARVTGETDAACEAALEGEGLQWLIGRDPRELASLDRVLADRLGTTPAARAAVDIALHDLAAQGAGLPLVDFLGRAHEGLPTSITIGLMDVDGTLREADEYLGRGFRILKVKTGAGVDADLDCLFALRAHVGPSIVLRVDPNEGYDGDALRRFVEGAAAGGLEMELLEQPVPAAAFDAVATLPTQMRARVAADESVVTEADAEKLLFPHPVCGIMNLKLMKHGGISPSRRIAARADLAGLGLMWGCMDESVVGISAALHTALASPATLYLDLDGSFDLARDPAVGGFTLEGGVLRPTGEPGLGVRLRS